MGNVLPFNRSRVAVAPSTPINQRVGGAIQVGGEAYNCPCCQEPVLTGQELVRCPQFNDHIFHKVCLGEWQQRQGTNNQALVVGSPSQYQATCPMCRALMPHIANYSPQLADWSPNFDAPSPELRWPGGYSPVTPEGTPPGGGGGIYGSIPGEVLRRIDFNGLRF